MSGLATPPGEGVDGSEARRARTQATRQASITRPTRSSETRSVRSREDGIAASVLTRQSSLRIPSHGIQAQTPSRPMEKRGLHVKTDSQSSIESTPRHKGMDKSTSMYDLSGIAGRSQRPKASLYASKQSTSSNSLASRTSPRRAGLGARTISPVEVQRSKRNSRLLEEEVTNTSAMAGQPHVLRQVSGIPSPIKPPVLSRTRPSPIPPVPALPSQIEELRYKRPPQGLNREPFRSVSGPTPIQRHRSATLASAVRHSTAKIAGEEKTSFTSPMKQSKTISSTKALSSKQLQPLTLPPFKVQSLSTPTIRKVNDMSQRIRTQPAAEASEHKPSHSTTMAKISTRGNGQFPEPSSRSEPYKLDETSSSSAQAIVPGVASTMSEVTDPGLNESTKSKEVNGFFSRLSLSRSSSRSKLKKKQSAEKVEDVPDMPAESQATPERRRRLSLSWMKGKMSPFGSSSSIPKIDPGIPPMIPKSFTSESLASQISQASSAELAPHTTQRQADGAHDNGPIMATATVQTMKSASVSSASSTSHIADEEMQKLIIASKGSQYLADAQKQLKELSTRASPRTPVDVTSVAELSDCPLNLYEKGEIIDYDGQIYFTGQSGLVKTGGRLDSSLNVNFGYDDDRGDYLINAGDHFAYRYEIVDVLGKGSFGQVLRCIDYKTGGLVAIKVIRNKQRFHAQALVEVRILKMLRKWDPEDKHHLIKYADHFHFRSHLCIATDLLGINLYEYIKANEFKGCTLNMIRSFTQQILTCLLLLKRERVIHCDLKPENILLVSIWESKIKIIDFGSSCFEDQKVYTYIQSRFYRSPEVILGMSYGLPIDIWSMGCILAELFTGFPIFPGEDEQEQLACIMEIFGPPEKHLIENSTRKKLFFDSLGKPRSVISSKGRRRKPSSKTLAQATKCNDEAFLDFLTRCLRWNPENRLTPEEALAHPFITGASTIGLSDTPRKPKRFLGNQIPSLAARPLPRTPAQPLKLRNGLTGQRSTSHTVTTFTGSVTLGSPSKSHRRVLSNLPQPRERVIT